MPSLIFCVKKKFLGKCWTSWNFSVMDREKESSYNFPRRGISMTAGDNCNGNLVCLVSWDFPACSMQRTFYGILSQFTETILTKGFKIIKIFFPDDDEIIRVMKHNYVFSDYYNQLQHFETNALWPNVNFCIWVSKLCYHRKI